MPLRFAVIGLGFGYHHVRTLRELPDAELVAVADRNPDLDRGLYEQTYGVTVYEDGLELLDKETLDALIISTSPKTRAALIEKAAQKNVALFVEKPWATDTFSTPKSLPLCAPNTTRR